MTPLRPWRRRPAFRRRVAELRDQAGAAAVGQLADSMTDAVAELRQLLADDDPRVRLGAARSLLSVGGKLREEIDIADQLEARERQASDPSEPSRSTLTSTIDPPPREGGVSVSFSKLLATAVMSSG